MLNKYSIDQITILTKHAIENEHAEVSVLATAVRMAMHAKSRDFERFLKSLNKPITLTKERKQVKVTAEKIKFLNSLLSGKRRSG